MLLEQQQKDHQCQILALKQEHQSILYIFMILNIYKIYNCLFFVFVDVLEQQTTQHAQVTLNYKHSKTYVHTSLYQ